MSADVGIAELLVDLGYGTTPDRARAALEAAGLTRPGKSRLSAEKIPRATELLGAKFFRHCAQPGCAAAAQASGREPFSTADRRHCESCGGSDNRKAEADFLEACRARGIGKVVVVGGSPAVREELEKLIGAKLQLRTVDGTARRTGDRARSDLEWADLVLIWGGSELDHKVSQLYTTAPPELRRKVVSVARRGVAALLGEAMAKWGQAAFPKK